jgi:RecA-family ATPase
MIDFTGCAAAQIDGLINICLPEKDDCRILLGDTFSAPHYLLTEIATGIGCLPTSDIHAEKGKQKSGKSNLNVIFLASLFGCHDFGFSSNMENPKALYFDTEQAKINSQMLLRKIHKLCNWSFEDAEKMQMFNLREIDMENRFSFIAEKVKKEKPDMVIIDGAVDLIADFNDIAESQQIIGKLMRLSSSCDCAIINVLHENKSKDDKNMRGHLGTMLVQKCSDCYEVVKSGAPERPIFNVEVSDCRNRPIEGFSFVLDALGTPQPTISQHDMKINAMRAKFAAAFGDNDMLEKSTLTHRLEETEGIKERGARYMIEKAINNQIITVNINGYLELKI